MSVVIKISEINDNLKGKGSKLPKVICNTVVRYSQKGESHGKIYLVDLDTDKFQEVFDWKDNSISLKERGYDRGLRGIAINSDLIYVAAFDKILVFDKTFSLLETIKGNYLKACHEIFIEGSILYITSTRFNSILKYDLNSKSFIKGYYLKASKLLRLFLKIERKFIETITNKLLKKIIQDIFKFITSKPKNSKPKLISVDPTLEKGPKQLDVHHINNVWKKNESIYISGTHTIICYYIKKNRLACFSRGSLGNHNLRPYKNGVLLCDTNANLITYKDTNGKILESFKTIKYDKEELINSSLPDGYARLGFARGLCVYQNDIIIGGSSPATISVYQFRNQEAIRAIRLSRDVRDSIHGLEIWPF